MNARKTIYIVLIIILLIVFCVSGYFVADYLLNSAQQREYYDNLAAIVEQAKVNAPERMELSITDETKPDGSAVEESGEPTILPEYQELYQRNDHLVGWLKIEDTKINYPVMQTPEEPNFYLERGFDRKYSAHGCLYVREECDVNKPSDNLTIYGHHMRDGSMLAGLDKYNKESYWEEHSYITFDTLYEHHTYRIFAVFKTSASVGQGFSYHLMDDAGNEEEFDNFIAKCKSLSFYDTGITPEYGDKIICLSTCEYTLTNGRLVVAAVRTDETE